MFYICWARVKFRIFICAIFDLNEDDNVGMCESQILFNHRFYFINI